MSTDLPTSPPPAPAGDDIGVPVDDERSTWAQRSPRQRGLIRAAGIALGLVVAAAIWFVIGQGPSDASTLQTATPLMTPIKAPTTTGTDTAGHPLKLVDTAPGTVSLVYFGYTHCPDVCPIDMGEMSAALQRLSSAQRAHVHLVFVTMDPPRDTPKVLRAWLDHFSTGFVGVVPTKAQTASILGQMDLPQPTKEKVPGGYDVSHIGGVYAFTGDGSAHVQFTEGSPAGQVAHDLKKLLEGWNDAYLTQ